MKVAYTSSEGRQNRPVSGQKPTPHGVITGIVEYMRDCIIESCPGAQLSVSEISLQIARCPLSEREALRAFDALKRTSVVFAMTSTKQHDVY